MKHLITLDHISYWDEIEEVWPFIYYGYNEEEKTHEEDETFWKNVINKNINKEQKEKLIKRNETFKEEYNIKQEWNEALSEIIEYNIEKDDIIELDYENINNKIKELSNLINFSDKVYFSNEYGSLFELKNGVILQYPLLKNWKIDEINEWIEVDYNYISEEEIIYIEKIKSILLTY